MSLSWNKATLRISEPQKENSLRFSERGKKKNQSFCFILLASGMEKKRADSQSFIKSTGFHSSNLQDTWQTVPYLCAYMADGFFILFLYANQFYPNTPVWNWTVSYKCISVNCHCNGYETRLYVFSTAIGQQQYKTTMTHIDMTFLLVMENKATRFLTLFSWHVANEWRLCERIIDFFPPVQYRIWGSDIHYLLNTLSKRNKTTKTKYLN